MITPRDLARATAAHGLPGTTTALPTRPLDSEMWDATLRQVVGSRCTGHLVRAIVEGAFAADDGQWARALDRHEIALGIDLVLERLLVETVTALEGRGIPVRALKGPALAHSVYDDPALRSYGDVDLLVAAGSYDAAIACLGERGAIRRYAEPRPGFDNRFGKGVCMVMHDGYEVDVHRTFVAGPFGLSLRTDDLFATQTRLRIGGCTLAALGPEERFVHACFHAALGDREPRLVALRDVAQILLCAPVDAERVRALSARWRVGAVVQRGIELAWAAFALVPEPDLVGWARAYTPSRFERQALRVYVGPTRSYAAQAVAGLRAVPDLAAKAAYARAMLVPEPGYVRDRDGGYVRRLRRGVELLIHDMRRQ